MAGKTNYNKSFLTCKTCINTKNLYVYRGFFYCEKCFKKRNKKQLKRDQEYARQLKKHILGS